MNVSGIKARIIRLLYVAGPITNSMLASMLGLTDRYVRELVQELRHEGYAIGSTPYISHGNKGGYILAKDDPDMCYAINKKKAVNRTVVEGIFDLENVDYTKTKYEEKEND